jgi:hypothetical protein
MTKKCFNAYMSTRQECYLNLPDDLSTDNPLDMKNIKENQDTNNALQQQAEKYPDCFLRQ